MPTETGYAVGAPAEANVKQAVPFYGVHDIEKSLRFYVDGLGCKVTIRWEPEGKLRWCWLELGDAAIMLQEFWKGGGGAPPQRSHGAPGSRHLGQLHLPGRRGLLP